MANADGAVLGLSALTNPQNIRSSMTLEDLAAIEQKITPYSRPQITDQDLDDSVDKILKDIARQVGSESLVGSARSVADDASEPDDDAAGDDDDAASQASAATSRSRSSAASALSRSSRAGGIAGGFGGFAVAAPAAPAAPPRAPHPSYDPNQNLGISNPMTLGMDAYYPESRRELSLADKLRERNRQANLDRALEGMQYHEEGLLDEALVEDQKTNLLIEIDQDWEELMIQRVNMSNITKPSAKSSLEEISLVHRRLREKLRNIQNADIGERGLMFVVHQMSRVCDGSRPYLPDLNGWGPQAKIILRRNRFMVARGVSKVASQLGLGDLGMTFMQLGASAVAYSSLRTSQNNAQSASEKTRLESRGLLSELTDMESAADVARYG